jgi:hypothetical protein
LEHALSRRTHNTAHGLTADIPGNTRVGLGASLLNDTPETAAAICFDGKIAVVPDRKSRAESDYQIGVG